MSDTTSHISVKQGSNKSFGLVFALLFCILSAWPIFSGKGLNLLFLAVAFTLFILTLFLPSIFRIPNYIWFKFGIFLGAIIAPIVMTLIYFFAFLPIGLALRMFNKDLLKIKVDKTASSYWQERLDKMQPMKNQF